MQLYDNSTAWAFLESFYSYGDMLILYFACAYISYVAEQKKTLK